MKLFIIVILIFCCSCNNKIQNSNIEFVKKYGNEDFSLFKNKSFIIRENDRAGNTTVFVFKGSSCGFMRFRFNKIKFNEPKRDFIYQKENCICDTNFVTISELNTFIGLNINSISVDSSNNIFIKTYFFEGEPNLIKIANRQKLKINNHKKLKQIKAEWYEIIDK